MKKLINYFFITILLLFSFSFVNITHAEIREWCETWNCLDEPNFEINVSWGDGLTPWKLWMEWDSLEERANWILWTIMQRLMIALWVLSVLIMTIWAWYIILNNWQDELLSKWKSIFMAWIYAMLIALTSYYLIAIVRYMLYA
mgnify:CR=1 FL=1